MSIQLGTNAARTLFDDSYHQEYQSMGPDLRPCVTFRAERGLKTYNFRTQGRLVMQARGASQSQVDKSNNTHALVACTLNDYVLQVPTDDFDQDVTNSPQEIRSLARVMAGAVKRQETQEIIDALDAATMDTNHTIADGGFGLTVAKLTEARSLLKANDINEHVALLYTEKQEDDLLQLSQFTSADFSATKMLSAGDVRDGHFGYTYKIIGTGRDETGLAVASNIRDCYAFVPSAVGLVVGMNEIKHGYEDSTVSVLQTAKLRCGAVAIDPTGIVKIQCSEA